MEGSGSNRWWENYLVRYFLPSIAGMLIVKWLALNTNDGLSDYIISFAIKDQKDFSSAHLIVWLLFGSFYCYLASYPILVFHATRSIDFKDLAGNPSNILVNPYITTFIFTVTAYIAAWQELYCLAIIATVIYSGIQLFRLFKVYSIQGQFSFNEGYRSSLAYAYLHKLAKRRSISKVEKEVTDDDGDKETTIRSHQKDLAESYRHLREHGNTAFIFFLELSFSPIVFIALLHSKKYLHFSLLIPILLVWVFPAVCVHWLGQHLERRFSLFQNE